MNRGVRREGEVPGRWLLAGFALAHIALFAVVFQTSYRLGASDIPIYRADAEHLFHGLVPYRDFVLEYPPFAAVVFALPRLAGPDVLTYFRGFIAEVLGWDLVILATLYRIALDRGERPALVLSLYTAFVVAIGPIVSQEFDLAPAAMTILALWLATRRRNAGAWVLLALGTLTKLYPLLIAPVFVLDALRRRDWRRIGAAIATGVVTTLIVMLPLLVVAPTAIASFFGYHAKRGIQVESSYGSLLLALDKLHVVNVGMAFSFGSWNITGAWLGPVITLSTMALAAAVIGAYVFLARSRRAKEADVPLDVEWLAGACLLVILAAILTSKVLSPQYLIWALPFVPLVRGTHARAIWCLYALIGIATYYIFPANYHKLVYGDDGAVIAVLVIRNLLLAALALLVAASLRSNARAATTLDGARA